MTEKKKNMRLEIVNEAMGELRDVALKYMNASDLPIQEKQELMQNIFINFFTYMMAQCVHGAIPKKKRNDFMNQVFIMVRQQINLYVDSYDKEEAQHAEDTKQHKLH